MTATFLAVLPSIHPPYLVDCLAGMGEKMRDRLLIIDNATGRNLGLAASWNQGASEVLTEGLDWLVILSAATRFGPAAGDDFIALLDRYDPAETWVIESSAPVNQHLFAMSRPCLERIGLFDQNFWPIYGTDADFCRRVHIAQVEDGHALWVNEPIDAWIAMAGHATKLAGITVDFDQVWTFYKRKWGGLSGHETFTRPFGDPTLPLSFWPTPPDPRSIIPPGGWA